jgi:hypothetical protein
MEVFTQLYLNGILPLSLKDILTSLAAFVGMSLGIYNFWKERDKEKVKLKVIPISVQQKVVDPLGNIIGYITSENEFKNNNPQDFFAIEVVNISRFAVTITQVGFLVSGTEQRISCPRPILGNQEKFPKKLEPREALTAYVDLQSILSLTNIRNVYCAFAKTSCYHTETGKTKALKQLIQYARN